MSRPGSSKRQQRVFIALDPPRELRDELAGWVRTASLGPAARPVPPENMHLTVLFLGSRSEAEIEIAAETVLESARPLAELACGAPAWLPRRKPRALAVEVHDPATELAGLHRGIVRELAATVDLEEPRRFRPHITVARFGRGARPTTELPPTPPATFIPESLTLYRSDLAPDGATYRPLASTPIEPSHEP